MNYHDWTGPTQKIRHVHCKNCGKIFEINKPKGTCNTEQPSTTRVVLACNEPWPFLKASLQAPKQPAKARTKRNARKPAPDAPEALL